MNATLNRLPRTLPRDSGVELVLEQGIIIFRASPKVQATIEGLIEKQKFGTLSEEEEKELDAFEEIDDYLSHVNRLIRNSVENGEVGFAGQIAGKRDADCGSTKTYRRVNENAYEPEPWRAFSR